MINILYYESSSGFGGSANALVGILDELDRKKFYPLIAIKNFGSQTGKIENMDIIKLRAYDEPGNLAGAGFFIHFFKDIIPEALKLYFFIRKNNINITHINNNILAGIPAIIASKIAGIPSICHIRQTRKLIKREKMIAGLVDAFILLSKDAVAVYTQDIPSEKLHVIHDGIDLREFEINAIAGNFRKEYRFNDLPVIGLVGRVVEGKGHKEFIMASKEVLKTMPKVKFVIVGSAKGDAENYYNEVIELAKSEKLEDSVIFTGWRRDVSSVISDLDVVIQATTTYPEGSGLTVVEAMALRKPVVATNIPGPSDMVVDGETGFLVPPGDSHLLADAILKLLNNHDLGRQMGERGRERAECLFDVKTMIRKIEQIYENALSKDRKTL
jgi:glycosyltransferase involved in cell wall biosynthesis